MRFETDDFDLPTYQVMEGMVSVSFYANCKYVFVFGLNFFMLSELDAWFERKSLYFMHLLAYCFSFLIALSLGISSL